MSKAKPSPWKRRILVALGCSGLFVLLAPSILVRKSVVVPLANRFAGLAPLQIDLQAVRGGWFQKVGIDGVRILDAEGETVASVANIKTEKSLLGFATNSSNLGTIEIQGLEAVVEVSNGTSDLEQALEPILATEAVVEEDGVAAMPRGRIVVTDSKLMVTESGRPEKWVIELKEADVELPSQGQLCGPTSIRAVVGDVGNGNGSRVGNLLAKVTSDADGKLSLSGQISNFPLEIWHVVAARVPGIPIEQITGSLSTDINGYYRSSDDFAVEAKGIDGQDLQIAAPELLGPAGLHLDRITLAGKVNTAAGMLSLQGASLQCDFANIAAYGDLPWPMEIPSLAQPLLENTTLDARGTLDLARLVRVAPDLVPIRDDLVLHSGTAEFIFQHDPTKLNSGIRLAGFDATAGGQKLTWNRPLSVDASVTRANDALILDTKLDSDFGKLLAKGDLRQGGLSGDFDLAQLYTEISRWIELPVTQMTGTVVLNGQWTTDSSDVVSATIGVDTTPMTIVTPTGQTQEPAWRVAINSKLQMDQGIPSLVNSADVSLIAEQEQLRFVLKEPLPLGAESSALAAFDASLSGDLANWMRRVAIFMTDDMPAEVGGMASFNLSGRLGLAAVEIATANWEAGPIQVKTQGLEFVEPRMIGSFRGNVNTADLMKLAVEDLTVQSTAISLTAKDAGQEGNRVGRAMYRVDLGRMLGNIAVDPSSASQTLVYGLVDGEFNWKINTQQANLQVLATGNQITVVTREPGKPDSPLWQEPSAKLTMEGVMEIATGAASVERLNIETPWMNYTGNVRYEGGPVNASAGGITPILGSQVHSADVPTGVVSASFASEPMPNSTSTLDASTLVSEGNLTYDASLLAQKLAPMTGNQVLLAGRHTTPVKANLVMRESDPSALSGLDASLSLGWEQANVAGIEIGKANIPLMINRGVLTSQAELAVSGGAMRWQLSSDLAAEELAIRLAPMNVLENVAITRQMCAGWLKYVAPLLADTTSVDGRLTLRLDEALLSPARPNAQTVRGQLLVHDAQVGPGPVSTSILSLVAQIDSLRQGASGGTASQSQSWLLLPEQKINFQMQDGRVHHENLSVKIGDASISTAGYVAVDGSMQLAASMPIPDDWVDKSPLLEGMRGTALEFPLGGTLTQPQLNTDFLRQFSRQAAQGAARGLLQQGLSKGLDKLFGPPTGGN